MTEPTAEQVDRERERAWRFMKLMFGWDDSNRGQPWSQQAETDVADAFARVRIQAHAAGRDEGLQAAEALWPEGDTAMYGARYIRDAIRALRGRG